MHPAKATCDDLQCLECFAGRAVIASSFARRGYRARAVDIDRSSHHDLSTPLGVVATATLIMRMGSGSIAHFGTVCTSFVWINKGTHDRCISFPAGRDLPYVNLGSHLCAVTAPRQHYSLFVGV